MTQLGILKMSRRLMRMWGWQGKQSKEPQRFCLKNKTYSFEFDLDYDFINLFNQIL